MNIIAIFLLSAIVILLFWNGISLRLLRKEITENSKEYYELKAKLNFIVASGSLLIILATYLGVDVKRDIIKNAQPIITQVANDSRHTLDSIIDSKNLLKAGIYIVSDLDLIYDTIYRFDQLITIDGKPLPRFTTSPKLLINSNGVENIMVGQVTSEHFILAQPEFGSSRGYSIIFPDGSKERIRTPTKPKFDVWIADYNPE